MGKQTSPARSRFRSWSSMITIGALLSTAVAVWQPSVATAAVERSGQLCFDVSGNPGDAAIVNLTPVRASARGFGLLISSDVKNNPPVASNTNYAPGTVDPNVAVAPIGTDGQVCYQNSDNASVDLVADHLGTINKTAFTRATNNGAPNRTIDTRINNGGPRLAPSGQLCFDVSGNPGDAAIVNLTPVRASARGFGLLISSDVKNNPPDASNTNYAPGTVDPNVAVAPIGTDGQVCYQNSDNASVDLIADHLGTINKTAFTRATNNGAPNRTIDTRIPVVSEECKRPTSTSYDTVTARTMFGLSSRAYEVEPGEALPGQRLDRIGSKTVHFKAQMACWELVAAVRGGHSLLGPITDTEVIVARNIQTNDLVVSFRGTELNLADILTDLVAARSPWRLPNGQVVSNAVHAGFAAAYLAVHDQLVNVLRAAKRPDVPSARVYFTGHSLGGALATLASIDLVDDLMRFGYSRTEVVTYTFGAPRSLSKEMSNHHATQVPVSFAVANPRDPVPHVPSAIGSTNPFSHIRNMTALHGRDSETRVRVDKGDGRDYGGCTTMIPTVVDHGRKEYNKRVGATNFLGTPTVWITIAGGENRLNWNTPIEGPCDWVGLWRTTGTLTSTTNPISNRNVLIDFNDIHTTVEGKGDDYWVGYVNMFGDLIRTREYFPTAPTVSMVRNKNLFTPDTIDFKWTVTDAGDHDIVVLYDRNPWTAGVNGWYDHPIWSRVDANGNDADGYQKMNISIGSDPNKWWVAYIMVDDYGRQRILSTSHGVRG